VKRLWIATIVLWALGLLALPTLVGAPSLFQMVGAEHALRPFVMVLAFFFFLAVVWLVAMLMVAFRHRGKDRTLALAVTAGMMLVFLGLGLLPMEKTVTIKVDLPPAANAASR